VDIVLIILKSYSYSDDIYLFGSILKNKNLINDIDLLILYESQDELLEKKRNLNELSIYYPLDIYYMSLYEEIELNFINKVTAKQLKDIKI
jgi:predicted nucleotidyltransferase